MNRLRVVIAMFAMFVCAGEIFAQAQIDTIAGTGSAGYTGDGGPALSATINDPQGIAYDGAGNLYIADNLNFVIRKVDAQTGVITTVAGNGSQGSSGDDGFATNAQLGSPVGIAVDQFGNIYIADQSNHRVRVVDVVSGVIVTIAGNGMVGFAGDGGPATSARLNNPQGVAVDTVGHIYIADTLNFRIRRVDFFTGIISTIAGTGFPASTGDGGPSTSAGLSSPRRVAVDPLTNDIYILDRAANARIRRIDFSNGIITTVAGGGMTIADSGIATDLNLGPLTDLAIDDNGVLYIGASFRVWKVENGMAEVIAGTGLGGYGGDGGDPLLAQFNNMSGVAFRATQTSHEIVLSDRTNHRIRKITVPLVNENYEGDTIAGTGIAGYSGNGGPAIQAQINSPQGLAYDGAGNLYIADNQNFVIRKVNAQTGVITTVAGNGQQGYSGDGGPATSARLGSPVGIHLDFLGNIFIADKSNHRVRFVDVFSGEIFTIAGNGLAGSTGDGVLATSAQLNNPQGVAVDSNGNLYIADTGNHRIRRVNGSTGIITTICGTGTPSSTGDGGLAINAGLTSPRRIAIDEANNIYILDRAANARIRRIDFSSGIISTIAGGGNTIADSGPATSLNLGTLTDLAIDENNDLILTSNLRVWRVSGGIATVIAGTGMQGYGGDSKTHDPLLATYNNLSGVAVNADNEIVLSDRSNHRIRQIIDNISIPGDLTGDGVVNVADLFQLLAAWGPCGDCNPGSCPADITNSAGTGPDCEVNVYDLFLLLANWTP